MSWFDDYKKAIDTRQDQLQKGVPTLVPFKSFPRLSSKVPGFIPGDSILITGTTGTGKSRFCRSLLKDTISFCKDNNLDVDIIINSLEETTEKFIVSSLSSALYRKYKVKANFFQLANYATAPMSETLRQQIDSCKEDVNLLQNYVDIVHIANPYGFFVHVLKHLFNTGRFYLGDKHISKFEEVKANSNNWDKYVPDNPYRMVIAVSDTLDAYQPESGKSKYETILTFSKFFTRKILGLQCNVISIFIQQQSSDLERIQTNFKGQTELEKLKPGLDTLLTCRAVAQDVSLAIGIFDPIKYGEPNYLGYSNLDQLKDGDFRSLVVLKTREGEKTTDNEVPCAAYFSRDEFIELPRPDDPQLNKFYL